MVSCFKELSLLESIIITRPDKGQGVVILDRSDYVTEMNSILNNTTKFQLFEDNLYKAIIKFEDKNNRLIDFLLKNKIINLAMKNDLRSTGSRPGIVYGSPKVHKRGAPLRPILSTCGSFNYKLSKYLASLLAPLYISDSYVTHDSFEFAKEIVNTKNDNFVMASFDVESLFTNVPVQETVDIILELCFPLADSIFHGYDRKTFKKVLDLCTKDNIFLFNELAYKQIDGAPMGACCSPTLANIFLSYYEKRWLDDCPSEFKPVLYRRYVDDCFLLFRKNDHISKFHDYFNSQYANIKFTIEIEQDNSLPYLDVHVKKPGNAFVTDLYRKPTITGLGMKRDSSIDHR